MTTTVDDNPRAKRYWEELADALGAEAGLGYIEPDDGERYLALRVIGTRDEIVLRHPPPTHVDRPKESYLDRHRRTLRDSPLVETATQTLHRLTSYAPPWSNWDQPIRDPRAWQGEANDLDHLPWFFKRYSHELPVVPLPRDLPGTEAPAVAVLAGSARVPDRQVDLAHLSRLLHLSAGVVRTTERSVGTWFYRAAGSAGARFPLELYVVIPEGAELPPGVYWYDPHGHALQQVAPPARGDSPVLVVTGVPWRTGWRYRERGYRHVYWDAGTMLSQLLAAADSAGVAAHLHTRFPDQEVSALVGAEGIHEWPVAVVALGDGAPALESTGAAAVGEVDGAPVEFGLVTAAQRAGDRGSLGPAWERGSPVDAPPQQGDPIEKVVLARGSQRLMDPTKSLPESMLRISMSAALRGIDVPHFVAVNNVEGVPPGLYRWPDLGDPVRAGDLRDELYRVALDQGLASDAAFVVIGAIDVSALDDREYREAQLAAGLVEGRLHLLAYGLGASASGMTFLDSEVPALIREQLATLLWTCVGVPEYKSKAGGLPGAPEEIRTVTPRAS